MDEGDSVQALLAEIAVLLNTNGEERWGSVFKRFHSQWEEEPTGTARRIMSAYGVKN